MRRIVLIGLALAFLSQGAWAQSQSAWIPEIRPLAGVYIPTGDQSDVLKNAALVGLQFGYEVQPNFHMVGTFGWTPTKAKSFSNDNKVSMYQYDAGGEAFYSRRINESWLFRPFIGLGAGARTYDLPDVKNAAAKTYLAGYGSLGAEFQMSRVALRLEGRDYVTQFKGLNGGDASKTRNDVVLTASLAFHLR